MTIDRAIRHDIEAELEWDPRFDARNIGVAVKDGIVTLSGQVESYPARWSAEEATQRVAGVKAVANEIKVTLESDSERSDADIARAAINALDVNVAVPAKDIHIAVHDGWLSLSGSVSYHFQKKTAEHVVDHLRGVRGVSNAITVRPPVQASASEIKSKIEAALQRRAHLDAQKIRVEIDDGTVTLAGDVPTWPERDAAEAAAWAAPGVASIENKLAIRP